MIDQFEKLVAMLSARVKRQELALEDSRKQLEAAREIVNKAQPLPLGGAGKR